MEIPGHILLPLLVCVVPVFMVWAMTTLFAPTKPQKRFPTHGRKPEDKSA